MSERPIELRTTDVDRVRQLVAGLFCPFQLTTRRSRYDASVRHDPLDLLGFTTIAYGNPVDIDVRAEQPRFLLQMALHGAFDARTTGPEHRAAGALAQVVQPNRPIHMRCSAECRMLVISADARAVEAQARALAGRDIDLAAALPDAVPLTGAGASLGRYIDFLHAESQQQGGLAGTGRSAGPALQMLLALLLQAIGAGDRPAAAPRSASQDRSWYVKRAEAFLEANLANDIGIADVVAAAGVSVRTLYYGFTACHGVAPMTWLKHRRLARAREDLAAADPAETSVTDVALRWGFGHLGRFAVDYRARFGESPSRTLRRA